MEKQALNGMKAFVIGPIGDEDAEPGTDRHTDYARALQVLDEVIRPACAAHRIPVLRADDITRAGEITEQIYRHLRDSPLVIADLTGANPNVMYELGLRHSTGKLTIPIGERGYLPFDIHAIRTILFDRSDAGLVKARTRLITMIGTALTDGADPVTATRIWVENEIVVSAVSSDDENDEGIDTMDSNPVPILQPHHYPDETADDDEPGLLELVVDLEEALPDLSQNLQLATSILGGITETFNDGAVDARAALTNKDKVVIANRLSHKLATFATRLSIAASSVTSDVDRFETGLRAMTAFWKFEDSEDRAEFVRSVETLSDTAAESIKGAEDFRDTLLNSQSHATSQMRAVYRRIAQALAALISASKRVSKWKYLLSPSQISGQ